MCSPAFRRSGQANSNRPNTMCLWSHVPKLSAVADRDRTWGANAEAGPAAHAAAATTAAGTSDDFISTKKSEMKKTWPRNFEARPFCGMRTNRLDDDVSGKTGLGTGHACFSCIGPSHNQTGKMNKLLSLLLLALAVVSTQGFAVSSGIPVMGGAVGGTLFLRCAGFSSW